LLDYPVISDSIHTFKSNELGQRTLALGDSAYQTFAAPILPWFSKPYGYVSPYVQKADTIGDQTLGKIDERFPVVKRPTADLYNDTRAIIFFPYQKAFESRDHVYSVYSDEYKKNEQDGFVAHGKAAVTTAFVVSNETLSWLSSFLSAKKDQASQSVNEKINQ
jgi:hypothetical protein